MEKEVLKRQSRESWLKLALKKICVTIVGCSRAVNTMSGKHVSLEEVMLEPLLVKSKSKLSENGRKKILIINFGWIVEYFWESDHNRVVLFSTMSKLLLFFCHSFPATFFKQKWRKNVVWSQSSVLLLFPIIVVFIARYQVIWTITYAAVAIATRDD